MKHSLFDGVRFAIAMLLSLAVSLVAAPNSVKIGDTSGSAQANRPFTISRVFVQGEFPAGQYPQARVSGNTLLTQVDVKNTWQDGSIKHALVSFIASVPANGNITVDFVSQSSPNNTGYLDQAGLLALQSGAWQAQIVTDVGTADARTILGGLEPSTDMNSSGNRYWMRGPIVTQVIVEDKSPRLAYDFGTDAYKCLHPVFVLTAYPTTNLGIKVEYILENVWMNKIQDQTYTLTGLTANGRVVFSKASFNYTMRTRWRKVFWAGAAPTGWADEGTIGVAVDYNLAYMTASKALPNFDITKAPSAGAITSELNDYANRTHGSTDEPQFCIQDPVYCGQWYKEMPTPGGRGDLAFVPRWYILYLYTFDKRLYNTMIADGLASGRSGQHLRDYDDTKFFDSGHTATAFGRWVSIDARPTGNPRINVGRGTFIFHDELAHEPDFAYVPYLITGDWYFLDELQSWATAAISSTDGCSDNFDFQNDSYSNCRHADWGWIASESRGLAWAYRDVSEAAFMSPDSTPEQSYFTQKLNNIMAITEGWYNILDGQFPPADPACPNQRDKWCWGRLTIAEHPLVLPVGVNNLHSVNALQIPDFGDTSSQVTVYTVGVWDPAKTSSPPAQAMFESCLNMIVMGRMLEMGFTGVTSVYQYWARWMIQILVNPDVNHYHIQDYVYPFVDNTGNYFTTWKLWNDSYLAAWTNSQEIPLWNGRSGDVEFGYPHIAYAASSFLPGVSTSEGYTGTDAWTWLKSHLPNQNLQNDNPKWAIVPRGMLAGSACDLDASGTVDIVDVQISINQALGVSSCGNGDLDQDGACTVIDIQRIVNAALGLGCRVGK